MIDYKTPNIIDLDSSHPDYVSKIDGAFSLCQEMYSQEINDFNDYLHLRVTKLPKEVGGLEGVVVDFSSTPDDLRTEITVKGDNSIVRKVQDLILSYKRDFEDRRRIFEDRTTALKRASEDFYKVAEELSQTEVLARPEGIPKTAHIYSASPLGVYETHLGFMPKNLREIPQLSRNLKPEDFSDKEFVDDFKHHYKENGALVILVKNPSTIVTPVSLLIPGISLTKIIITEESKKAQPAKKAWPLVNSLRKALASIGK